MVRAGKTWDFILKRFFVFVGLYVLKVFGDFKFVLDYL